MATLRECQDHYDNMDEDYYDDEDEFDLEEELDYEDYSHDECEEAAWNNAP